MIFGHLDVSGPPKLRDLLNLVDATHVDSQQWRGKNLLLVLTKIGGQPDLVRQALFGEHIASRLSHISKIATVVPQELITHNSERMARRTAQILRFSLAKPRQWSG